MLAVAHPGDPRRAADLAEFDARYTQDGDGVHGARAMAAALALALVGANVDDCTAAALAELPAETEIGRNARHALDLAHRHKEEGTFALVPLLEHQIVDHVYSYGIAAAETVPVALALATAAEGRIAEAVPAAACLSRVADSAPALVSALTGALGGAAAIPDTWREACRTLSGCALPASPAPISYTSPNFSQPRNSPPQEDDSGMTSPREANPHAMPHAGTGAAANAEASLEERITGALVGAAVGDALGGPVEGYTPEQILERHGGRVHGIVGPWNGDGWRTARPIAPYHKGDGHVTDDTLMTHALVRVYDRVRDHLDAYAIAEHLVPDMMTTPRWIPELEAEALPFNGSSSPRSGSWPASTTATSTPERPAPATSSTAAPRCTWPPSAWSTPPTRPARTPRPSTSRARTSRPTAGRRQACSRRGSRRRARRARPRSR